MIGLSEIEAARGRIAGHVLRTELRHSSGLSTEYGAPVHLKLEHHQITGSFKLRGATNAILSLGDEARARGVATASTGNHGRAVAHAARAAGVRAVICMSSLVPRNKLAAVEALGAEIRIVGRSQDEAQREVDRLAQEEGVKAISPFDDAPVIAGQGTLGLEIVEALPETAAVVVPLSGGGLIAGIAAAVKARAPEARIVGVSMERGPAMHESLKAGKPVAVEEQPSLADSLGGGIGLENRHTFEMCRTLVDETILLTEAEIADGVRYAYWKEHASGARERHSRAERNMRQNAAAGAPVQAAETISVISDKRHGLWRIFLARNCRPLIRSCGARSPAYAGFHELLIH